MSRSTGADRPYEINSNSSGRAMREMLGHSLVSKCRMLIVHLELLIFIYFIKIFHAYIVLCSKISDRL